MILLALLRPPPTTLRRKRPPMDLERLGALLLADEAARVLRKNDDSLMIVVDTGTGQNLGVTVRADGIWIVAAPKEGAPQVDEEHGGVIEDDDRDIEDAAGELVSTIQAASGWHVESDRLLGFDPSGVCPSCQIECFEWQDRCSVCDADLEQDDDGVESDDDERAHQLLQSLLREELIELVSTRGVQSVESCLAASLANRRSAPETLLALLVDLKEVAEVFASEEDIARLLPSK